MAHLVGNNKEHIWNKTLINNGRRELITSGQSKNTTTMSDIKHIEQPLLSGAVKTMFSVRAIVSVSVSALNKAGAISNHLR